MTTQVIKAIKVLSIIVNSKNDMWTEITDICRLRS